MKLDRGSFYSTKPTTLRNLMQLIASISIRCGSWVRKRPRREDGLSNKTRQQNYQFAGTFHILTTWPIIIKFYDQWSPSPIGSCAQALKAGICEHELREASFIYGIMYQDPKTFVPSQYDFDAIASIKTEKPASVLCIRKCCSKVTDAGVYYQTLCTSD